MPFAKALRERGHKNSIGFFIHIPCPPPEILTALPNHERLIPALGYYDLVGFQTEVDANNFARYLADECRLKQVAGDTFAIDERSVRVGVFPVGVETEPFARLARRAVEIGLRARGARQPVRPRHDHRRRPARLLQGHSRAHECLRALPDQFPRLARQGDLSADHAAQPHRHPGICRYRAQVGETVGRINGAYGEASWTPVRYINKAHSRTALAGLYRAARAALVTPLRDGMNLVAKEYVAAQDADDPGVLVLSRFAGAAHECAAALLVNPYDPEGVAIAINRALAMPFDERRQRHAANYQGAGGQRPLALGRALPGDAGKAGCWRRPAAAGGRSGADLIQIRMACVRPCYGRCLKAESESTSP